MRAMSRSVFLLVMLSPLAAPLRAQAFEGTLTFLVHGVDGDKTITEWVKPPQTRYDFAPASGSGPSGTMIINTATKTRTVIMPGRRMYMSAPFDPAAHKAGTGEKSDVKWTRTGKTETVAGVKCEVIHGAGTENGKPKEADICVARGIGFGGGSTGGGPFSEALTEYANLNLGADEGIVKMTSIEGGHPQVALELTKVDRHTLAVTDFQPPPGFTKYERPAGAAKP